MKVLVEKFCLIATDEPWLLWLYDYDLELYNQYISDLKDASGCSGKRELVSKTLEKIDSDGYGYKLLDFLGEYYPKVLVKDSKYKIDNPVFPDYKPGILSYPRRIILKPNELDGFVSDKLKYEHIIVDGVVYLEYLLHSDEGLDVPEDNWLVRKFKNDQR